MVDVVGTTKYTYYEGGLLNTEDGRWVSDTVTYSYNNARLRSGLSLQQPTGTWTNGLLYDAAKRLSNLTSQAGAFAYSYAAGMELPLVTDVTPNGFLRNDSSVWVGFQFTVGAVPMTVSSLGRWVVSGNSGSHTVQLFNADGTAISGGSVTLNTAGQPAGQFAYAPLANPVALAANTTYVLMSQETVNADQWYDYGDTLITLSGAASGTEAVYADIDPPPVNSTGAQGMSYGPVNLKFAVGGASELVRKITLPNTSYITNTYDSVARLTGTYLKNSANTVLDQSEYLYNVGNQRVRLTRTDGSYYTNSYDNIGQLTWADSTVASEERGYLYDAAWNLNKRTNNLAVYTFTVDGKNQLTNATSVGTQTYDDNGNVTYSAGNSRGYSYDDENRLVNWYYYDGGYNGNGAPTSPADLRTEFVYDGRTRLRKRVDYTATGGFPYSWAVSSETRYLYDGMRVIQERSSANTPTVSYTRGSDLTGSLEGAGGIGGLLARSHGYSSGNWSTHNFYHADGGGNITMMIDSSQVTTASYRYDPYGNIISTGGGPLSSANVYRFSSKEIHPNSGFYYYGYRFYDPGLQRWLNRDPLGERGGINLFEFVGNVPTHAVDRFGLQVIVNPPPPGPFPGANVGPVWIEDPYDLSDINNEFNHLDLEPPPQMWLPPGFRFRCPFGCPNDKCPKHFVSGPLPAPPPPPPTPPPWPGNGCSICPVNYVPNIPLNMYISPPIIRFPIDIGVPIHLIR